MRKKRRKRPAEKEKERVNECRLHGGVMNDTSLGSHSSICPSCPPLYLPPFPLFFPPSSSTHFTLCSLHCHPYLSLFSIPSFSYSCHSLVSSSFISSLLHFLSSVLPASFFLPLLFSCPPFSSCHLSFLYLTPFSVSTLFLPPSTLLY